jgi:YVTN family beta-propeller protein
MSFDHASASVDSRCGGFWIRCFAGFSRKRCLLGLCSVFCATLLLSPLTEAVGQPAESSPLQLETKIALGDVHGRIDHMAVDLKRQRLFVAELGNDSVGVVDLANRKLLQTITGLKEPQGVGYEPSTDTLYVTNAGDGSVRLFEGNAYKPNGQIELGSDADNVRVDPVANRILIGYGSGALAIIDPTTRNKVGDIPVKAHPEASRSITIPGKSSSTCRMPMLSPSWTAPRKSKLVNGRYRITARTSRWPWISCAARFW